MGSHLKKNLKLEISLKVGLKVKVTVTTTFVLLCLTKFEKYLGGFFEKGIIILLSKNIFKYRELTWLLFNGDPLQK